jgi:hypothetical protein
MAHRRRAIDGIEAIKATFITEKCDARCAAERSV